MDAVQYQNMSRFSGINNKDKAVRLFESQVAHDYVYPLQQAANVEIDDSYELASRTGYTSVKSGADIHSLWSDGTNCLFVDGTTLYKMGAVYETIIIRSDLTRHARMSYVTVNDRIYYSNGHEIGFVNKDLDNALMVPGREFKAPLPAGQLIEIFLGCLLLAADDILYISDPLCDYYDTRIGYRKFTEEITMVRAVDDGVYISDSQIWFMKGRSNEDFIADPVYPSRAIPFTDLIIPGQHIGNGDQKGNLALWTSENGICLGDNSGNVKNLTEERYAFTARGRGTGFIRDINNKRHYINSLY